MRRVWIALTVIAVASALALPAAAVKPDKTRLYEVTMTIVGDGPGLSTGCNGEVSILMLGTAGRGTLALSDTDTPGEVPSIFVRAPAVVWERAYPTPTSSAGNGFNECHGPSVYDGLGHPGADYGGALWITIDYDAGTVEFLWHFDYYIAAEDLGVKKPRWVATVREHYTMSTTASYDENGRVQGLFPFSWFLREGKALVHGYDRFDPVDGTNMTFDLVVAPIDG